MPYCQYLQIKKRLSPLYKIEYQTLLILSQSIIILQLLFHQIYFSICNTQPHLSLIECDLFFLTKLIILLFLPLKTSVLNNNFYCEKPYNLPNFHLFLSLYNKVYILSILYIFRKRWFLENNIFPNFFDKKAFSLFNRF